MGIFDFLKKNKNIENDNGFNEIYNDVSGFFRLEGYKKDGLRDGLWKESHIKNGTLVKEENYKGGIRHGESKTFDSRGISQEVNYKNGEKEGVETHYWIYPNKKSLVLFYVKGKQHGTQLCFWISGTFQSERDYKNGEKDGIQKWYYKNGQLGTKTNYIEGEITSKKCWDENGNEIDEESFTGHLFGVQ